MKIIFTTFLTTFVLSAVAQMNLDWMNNTELAAANNPEIKQGPDGHLYFIIKDQFGGIDNGSYFIQKIDPAGNLIWQFGEGDFFDGMNSHYLDFDIDSDNNVYVVGTQFDQNDLYPKTEIIKINSSGTEVWREDFTTTTTWSEAIEQIEITSDDRIFLIARLYDPAINTLSRAFIEMDTDGNTITLFQDTNYSLPLQQLHITSNDEIFVFNDDQIKRVNYSGQEEFNYNFSPEPNQYMFSSIYNFDAIDEDESHLYLAHTISTNNGPVSTFVISKIKKDGSENIQSTIIPFASITDMLSVLPVYVYTHTSGEIYVCGYMFYGQPSGPNLTTNDSHDVSTYENRGGKGGSQFRKEFVVKLNSDLQLIWSKEYNFMSSDNGQPAGGFFHGDNFVYHTSIQDGSSSLPYFIAHDVDSGDIIWTHTQQPTELFSTFMPASLITGEDQAIYAYGRGELYIDNQMQYQNRYISKYSLEDFVNVAEQENLAFRLYPNPANDFINIESKSSTNHIVIYDSTGRIVLQKTEFSPNFRIDINTLAPGLYVFNLNGETRKILVE
jgi:hypothetical protein